MSKKMTNTYKSSSAEQQEAEKEILQNFVRKYKLIADQVIFPTKFPIQIDGIYTNRNGQRVWVEVYAHQEKLKGAQPKKICTDILKLITAEKMLGLSVEKWILFGSEEAKSFVDGESWYHEIIKNFDIHLETGELSPQTIQKIQAAQHRPKMVNA